MKKNILIILSILFSLSLLAQNDMKTANKLYSSEKYQEAIDMYEKILKNGEESAALYYNLGNAYYKMNEIAPAILNYERSLLRDPSNENAKFNLELSRSKVVDKIDKVDTFFLKSFINSTAESMSSNSWAWLSIITFIIFIVCVFLYVFARYRILKKTAFYAGCFIFIISVFSFSFAKMQKDKITDKNYAIIFEDTVTVKGSPDESGTDLFLLHEGTKVKIRTVFENKEWYEIEIEDGNTGWLKSDAIEKI